MVRFRFGERDVTRVPGSAVPQELKDELAGARVYPEGRGLRLPVRAAAALPTVLELLQIRKTPEQPRRG